MICWKELVRTSLIGVLIGGGAGCASSFESVEGPRYVFQHSMLNYDATPHFPKRFTVPEPLSQDIEIDEKSTSNTSGKNVYTVKDWSKSGGNGSTEFAETGSASEEVVAEDPTSSGLDAVGEGKAGEGAQGIQLASARKDDDSALDDILTGSSRGASSLQRDEDLNLNRKVEEAREPNSISERGMAIRTQLRETAEEYVGIDGEFTERSFIQKVMKVNEMEASLLVGKEGLRALYKDYRNRGLSYDSEEPSVGDFVFFHNTRDQNVDSRNNDWYSSCGVVSQVGEDGTVEFIAVVDRKVQKFVMNLKQPEVRRDESRGKVMNSYLRKKSLEDPEFTQYLAGELFAGFVSLSVE